MNVKKPDCLSRSLKRNLAVFQFCNDLGKKVEWKELNKEFSKGIEFQVIDEKEWQKRINEIFCI